MKARTFSSTWGVRAWRGEGMRRAASGAVRGPAGRGRGGGGGGGEAAAQIMVRCEQRPSRCAAAKDLEADRGAAPKAPPFETALGGVIDPVGLKPGDDVVVASDGEEAQAVGADRAGQGGRADLGDGAVDHGGELVEDDRAPVGGGAGEGLGQEAGEGGAEL